MDFLDLANGCPRRTIAAGDLLVVDGADPTALYAFLDGALRIEKSGVVITTLTDAGACIGEMSLLLGVPAHR
jgi:hypothetical protein